MNALQLACVNEGVRSQNWAKLGMYMGWVELPMKLPYCI
jgi:hypothetical protein